MTTTLGDVFAIGVAGLAVVALVGLSALVLGSIFLWLVNFLHFLEPFEWGKAFVCGLLLLFLANLFKK